MLPFADRLAEATRRCGNPVVVGLDPRWTQLPAPLRGKIADNELEAQAAAYGAFCRGVIDVVAPLVPAVKPQSAFFEELGPAGMSTLADVIRYARDNGLLVILDGKRNDIGPTAEAYARGYLGEQSAWGADALTVNPYLGDDSLQPFVDTAQARHSGIFVLVKTSNKGGSQFQDRPAPKRALYAQVASHVEELALRTVAACGYGVVGAVVGATFPRQLAELRMLMPHAWLLIPGYGAQGASARDVVDAFDEHGRGAVVNSSRAIIFAHERAEYRERFGDNRWQDAVAAATQAMIDELRAETTAGRLRSSV